MPKASHTPDLTLTPGLRAVGSSISGVSYAGVLIAAVWIGVALYLGRTHDGLQRSRAPATVAV